MLALHPGNAGLCRVSTGRDGGHQDALTHRRGDAGQNMVFSSGAVSPEYSIDH